MSRFYATAVMLAAAASAFAAAPVTVTPSASHTGLAIPSVETVNAKAARHAAPKAHAKTPAKAPEGDWTSIGTGTWCEDFFTAGMYKFIDPGQQWEVEVEESATTPGWYRVQPYTAETTLSKMYGPDATYIYINATEPDMVYVEDFTVYYCGFSNMVPENGWDEDEYDYYGIVEDGVILFEPGSFTVDNRSVCTVNTGFMLYLPGGAEAVDYTFSLSGGFCANNNQIPVTMTCGSSIASVKVLSAEGYYTCDEENNAPYVAENGKTLEPGTPIQLNPQSNGMSTLLAVALDADGEIVGTAEKYFFGSYDDSDNWTAIGEGTFTEGIYASQYAAYGYEVETLQVQIEQHNSIADYYRVVTPYETHSVFGSRVITHDDHNHYMYIRATRPEYVVVEGSALGVRGAGEAAVYSYGAMYEGTKLEETAKDYGFFGTFDTAARVITLPEDRLLLAETNYDNGAFYPGNYEMTITLPEDETVGITNVAAGSDANAPATYYNLQGQRVPTPASGQLLIKRQGDQVTKTIVR